VTAESVVVEADGGSRGNPGPAGFGAVVFDAVSGGVLAERAESIGTATNNVAEYRGLIAGLAAAQELGARQVSVRMDSKLVVEQMSGRWQVKHPDLRPLARAANDLRRRFDQITFQWVPREQNRHADRLANEAMDAAAGLTRARRTAPPVASVVDAVPSSGAAERSAAAPPVDRAVLARRVKAAAFLRGEFSLRAGQQQSDAEFFDSYLVQADPTLLADAAAAMAALVPDEASMLAGLQLGGVPLATLLGQLTKRPVRFVRTREGRSGRLIEGGPVDGEPVVLIDDAITDGAAPLAAVETIRGAGGVLDTVVCFIDRGQGGRAALAGAGIALRAVLDPADLA
jgi:orotate phosphoribosyltransferase